MEMTPSQMGEVVESHKTVSGKIRALNAAGIERKDIARFLNKRYQHVRNVLEDDKVRSGRSESSNSTVPIAPSVRESPSPAAEKFFRLQVDSDGKLTLPLEVVDKLDAHHVPVLIGRLEGAEFTLISAAESIRQARDLIRRYIPEDVDLVAELIAERRAEVEAEAANG